MKDYTVAPDARLKLADLDPADLGKYSKDQEAEVEARTGELILKLETLQEKLYASSSRALLVVLQAMDAGGKDGTIKKVFGGVNPQGCNVTSFKVPTTLERQHDFLWRIHKEVPAFGFIGVFNRSHYEDLLVPRVHGGMDDADMGKRVKDINNFEHLLHHAGTKVLKFFLHISSEEQRRRLQARVDDPHKHWKFNPGDLVERKLWDQYQAAYEEILPATSTDHAPWVVVPADHKWYRNLVVASTIVDALEAMDLHYPTPADGVDWATLKVEKIG